MCVCAASPSASRLCIPVPSSCATLLYAARCTLQHVCFACILGPAGAVEVAADPEVPAGTPPAMVCHIQRAATDMSVRAEELHSRAGLPGEAPAGHVCENGGGWGVWQDHTRGAQLLSWCVLWIALLRRGCFDKGVG